MKKNIHKMILIFAASLIIILLTTNRVKNLTVKNGQEDAEAKTVELSTNNVKASNVSPEMDEIVETTTDEKSDIEESDALDVSEEFEEMDEDVKVNETVNLNRAEKSNKVEDDNTSKVSTNKKNAKIEKKTEPVEVVKVAEETRTPIEIPKSTLAMTTYLLPEKNSELRYEDPTHILLHFTSNAFNKPHDPYQVEDTYNILKDYGLSAHYMIDRTGEIYLLVDENRVAYHAGKGIIKGFPEYELGLNHYSIGIELLAIGTKEEMIPIITEPVFNKIDPSLLGYTEEQYQSLNRLIKDIQARNPKIKRNRTQILGHDEYTNRKTDPGKLFDWSKIGF